MNPYAPAVLKIPLRKYRRGRVKVREMPAAPLTALVVTSVDEVEFKDGGGDVSLTLDVNAGYALVDPLIADPAQWVARFGGYTYAGIAVARHGDDAIHITFEQVEYDPAGNTLSYGADPSDIADTEGRMLAGFSGLAI